MNEKESMMHKATRKALDVMIRRTYDGWPPFSPCGVYQPHRPEKPLPKPQEKKETVTARSPPHRARRIPYAAGAFLFYGLCVLRPYMQMEKQCTQKINILM